MTNRIKKKTALLIWAVLTVSTAAMGQQLKTQSLPAGTITEISWLNQRYFSAYQNSRPSVFTDLFTPDCWIMPADHPALCGPDAALDFFRASFDQQGIRNGKHTTKELFRNGDGFLTESGEYLIQDAENLEIEKGKYLVLWKNTPLGWKIHRYSFAGSSPEKARKQ